MITALLCCAGLGASTLSGPAVAPSVTFELVPNTAAPGATVQGRVVLEFSRGYHGFQDRGGRDDVTPVTVVGATPGVVVRPTFPKAVFKTLGGEVVAVYQGRVVIPIAVTVPKAPGTIDVLIKVGVQQSDGHSSSPPASVTLGMTLTVI